MQFDMVCACGAALTMDIFDEDNMLGGWMLVHRFTNAHVSCGYMTTHETEEIRRNGIRIEMTENNEP